MKFTLAWLKNHLETEASLQEITDRLTMLGLELEDVEDRAAGLAPPSAGPGHSPASFLELVSFARRPDGGASMSKRCSARRISAASVPSQSGRSGQAVSAG